MRPRLQKLELSNHELWIEKAMWYPGEIYFNNGSCWACVLHFHFCDANDDVHFAILKEALMQLGIMKDAAQMFVFFAYSRLHVISIVTT